MKNKLLYRTHLQKLLGLAKLDELAVVQKRNLVRVHDLCALKGVRWSRKAPRAGIESEGRAQRNAGKSP